MTRLGPPWEKGFRTFWTAWAIMLNGFYQGTVNKWSPEGWSLYLGLVLTILTTRRVIDNRTAAGVTQTRIEEASDGGGDA